MMQSWACDWLVVLTIFTNIFRIDTSYNTKIFLNSKDVTFFMKSEPFDLTIFFSSDSRWMLNDTTICKKNSSALVEETKKSPVWEESSLLTFFELKRPGAFMWGKKAVAGCISRLCQIDAFCWPKHIFILIDEATEFIFIIGSMGMVKFSNHKMPRSIPPPCLTLKLFA